MIIISICLYHFHIEKHFVLYVQILWMNICKSASVTPATSSMYPFGGSNITSGVLYLQCCPCRRWIKEKDVEIHLSLQSTSSSRRQRCNQEKLKILFFFVYLCIVHMAIKSSYVANVCIYMEYGVSDVHSIIIKSWYYIFMSIQLGIHLLVSLLCR
jgi:hypothetical protein